MPQPIIQSTQHPILPWEITDSIIDHLHSDVQALGSCSAVCSEWLIRSRFHMFSTVHLWPWRVQRFIDLASSDLCTFVPQIRCIEVDDTRLVDGKGGKRFKAGYVDPSARVDADVDGDGGMLLVDAMSRFHFLSRAPIRSIHIHNFDWTRLSLGQQHTLRRHLSHFPRVQRLELHGAIFHDLREVVRIVETFPALYHLTANVTFLKLLEHVIPSAMGMSMNGHRHLRSIELGTDDAIPVVLSSLAGRGDSPQCVKELKLHEVKESHLPYIQTALSRCGKDIQRLFLEFTRNWVPKISKEEFIKALNFAHLSGLQTLHISGLTFTKDSSSFINETLSSVLASIESSFLESIHLQFYLNDETCVQQNKIRWCSIEHVLLGLHFFGMRFAVVTVDVPAQCAMKEEQVEQWVRVGMKDLHSRGALRVTVVREGVIENGECCSVTSNE